MPHVYSMLQLHTKTALLALTLLIAWGAYQLGQTRGVQDAKTDAEIAVDHAAPAAISITHSINGSAHLVDVTNDSAQSIGISLPETWERDEVRNVPLAQITASDASLGFRRWQLPPNASVTYETSNQLGDVTVRNPSAIPLRIKVITIDMQKNTSDTQSYLIQTDPLSLTF